MTEKVSKVFFTDMKTKHHYSLLDKFDRLLNKAGIESVDFKNKLTATKFYFGEPGNLAYICPNSVTISKLFNNRH